MNRIPQRAIPGTFWLSASDTLYLVIGATSDGDGMTKVRAVRLDRNDVVQVQMLSTRDWRTLSEKGSRLDGEPTEVDGRDVTASVAAMRGRADGC